MKTKILFTIAILSLLSLAVFVMANEQEMYNQGFTKTAICGNNICERMYFEIGQEETQVHNINNQQITFRTEKVSDGRTIFHVNELADRAGGAMQDLKSDLKSKYGFMVSDASYTYENPSANYEDLVVTGHGVHIEESEYCPQDCMQGLGRVNIEEGWNILSEGVVTDLRLYNLNDNFDYENDISAIYQYIPVLNKYVLTKPRDNSNEEKIINELVSKVGESKAEEILEQRNKAVWVYSTKTATIYYKQESIKLYGGIESIKLFNGWNFVGFNEDMFKERDSFSWNRIKGDCTYEKIYGWNPELKEWMEISPQTDSFDFNDFFGSGMLVKVSNECSLSSKGTGGTTTPPTLPN